MTFIRNKSGKKCLIPGKIRLRENLQKNEATFSVSFKVTGVHFSTLIRRSGLWRPIINANDPAQKEPWNFQSWSASLRNNAHAHRGLLGARFDNDADVIIDICGGGTPAGAVTSDPLSPVSPDVIVTTMEEEQEFFFETSEPDLIVQNAGTMNDSGDDLYPPETSWISWEARCTRATDHNRVRHKPLSGTVTYQQPGIDPFGPVTTVANDKTPPSAGWISTVDDIMQQVASPSLMVRFIGHGIRVAHRVNPPMLVSYGGEPVSLFSDNVSERVVGVGETHIYRTDWDLVYLVGNGPGEIPVLSNPMLGSGGSGGMGGLILGITG